jgi:uncharacterized damage-inducible protein DinB
MHASDIHILYDYNYWANERILEATARVSEEQFYAEVVPGLASLHSTLAHTMAAEWVWRMRCQEGISPPAMPRAGEFPTLEELRTHWREEEQQMRAFLDTLRDEDMNYVVAYTTTRGTSSSIPLWQALTHLVNHGMQHRSEAAVMLTSYGQSPGNIDFLVFLREHPPT